MSEKGHNCNLCKKAKYYSTIGNVCFGEKYRGKIIQENNAICDEYEFGGYEPECDMFGAYTITQNIIAKVADAQECACIEAIRIWAREKGYDDVLLMDESKLKEIIALGSAEYERLHKKDSK